MTTLIQFIDPSVENKIEVETNLILLRLVKGLIKGHAQS
jgi:hypothetical protein